MKNLISALLLVCCFQLANARTLAVTSSSDDLQNPIPGMLRYFIKYTQPNDTITFNVSNVLLKGEILMVLPVVIDGGINKVTLDGGGVGRIFNVFLKVKSDKFVFKNLIFINGKVYSINGLEGGGAMVVSRVEGELMVDNCIFRNNEHSQTGGAVLAQGGIFTNCIFTQNRLTNIPSGSGGVYSEDGLFINCVFSYNRGYIGAGVSASRSKFYNCTFANNRLPLGGYGGGIVSHGCELVNCIAYGNSSNEGADNVRIDSSTVIKNCAMGPKNARVGRYGNISLTSSPFIGGNGADSLSIVDGLCVNGGTTVGITILDTDILGNKRIIGATIDVGAYESPYLITSILSATTYNSSQILDPNPSKGMFYLNSKMLEGDKWEVEVYDLVGHLVLSVPNATVFNIPQAGIYQVRVKSRDTIYSNKIVVE